MNKAIDQILAEGYRNILIVPVQFPPGFVYRHPEYRVHARHWMANPKYTGERYPVGTIVNGQFYDDIPF